MPQSCDPGRTENMQNNDIRTETAKSCQLEMIDNIETLDESSVACPKFLDPFHDDWPYWGPEHVRGGDSLPPAMESSWHIQANFKLIEPYNLYLRGITTSRTIKVTVHRTYSACPRLGDSSPRDDDAFKLIRWIILRSCSMPLALTVKFNDIASFASVRRWTPSSM